MSKNRGGTAAPAQAESTYQLLSVDALNIEESDRDEITDASVDELAASIQSNGILVPLLATPNGEEGKYTLVAGRRRLHAAKLVGLEVVPVMIQSRVESERLIAMAVENLQREDLTVIEEANTYKRLTERTGLNQRELADRIGKSQSHISKRVALLKLPADVLALVGKPENSGGIKVNDALALTKLVAHPEAIHKIIEELADDEYANVDVLVEEFHRELEREGKIKRATADLKKRGIPSPEGRPNVDWFHLEDKPLAEDDEPTASTAPWTASEYGSEGLLGYVNRDGSIAYACTFDSLAAHAEDEDERKREWVANLMERRAAQPASPNGQALPFRADSGSGATTQSSEDREAQAHAEAAIKRAFFKTLRGREKPREEAITTILKKGRAKKESMLEFILFQFNDLAPMDVRQRAYQRLDIAKVVPEGRMAPTFDVDGFLAKNRSENLLRLTLAIAIELGEAPLAAYPERKYIRERSLTARMLAFLDASGYTSSPEERMVGEADGTNWNNGTYEVSVAAMSAIEAGEAPPPAAEGEEGVTDPGDEPEEPEPVSEEAQPGEASTTGGDASNGESAPSSTDESDADAEENAAQEAVKALVRDDEGTPAAE